MLERVIGYAVAAVATVVAIIGVLGIADAKIVTSAVLAVLAVLATVLARHHGTLFSIQEQLAINEHRGTELRFEYPDLGDAIDNAHQIDVIAGISFKTTVGTYYAHFLQSLTKGCRVRLVCPNPANDALCAQILASSPGRSSSQQAKVDIITGVMNAQTLIQDGDGDCVQIRVMDYLPTFGLVLIRPKSGPARVWLKPMAFRATNGEYPVLELRESPDGAWIQYFERQFKAHWDAGVDVTQSDLHAQLEVSHPPARQGP